VFTLATAEGRVAEVVRTRIAPLLIPRVVGLGFVREYLFRTLSQVTLNYRDGPLSRGSAAGVHGGDRLPWVRVEGVDNFDSLASMAWQVHVYGSARAELAAYCRDHALALNRFDWRAEHEAAGLMRDALYLLRPDTYVALADHSGAPAAIELYFADAGIRLVS
jgi:hypothetical protein